MKLIKFGKYPRFLLSIGRIGRDGPWIFLLEKRIGNEDKWQTIMFFGKEINMREICQQVQERYQRQLDKQAKN